MELHLVPATNNNNNYYYYYNNNNVSRGGCRGARAPTPPLNFASYNFIIYPFLLSKTPDSSFDIQSHFMPPPPPPPPK